MKRSLTQLEPEPQPQLTWAKLVDEALITAMGRVLYYYPYFTIHKVPLRWKTMATAEAGWPKLDTYLAVVQGAGATPETFMAAWTAATTDRDRQRELAQQLLNALFLMAAANSTAHHYGSFEVQVYLQVRGVSRALALLQLPGASDLFETPVDYTKALRTMATLMASQPSTGFVRADFFTATSAKTPGGLVYYLPQLDLLTHNIWEFANIH